MREGGAYYPGGKGNVDVLIIFFAVSYVKFSVTLLCSYQLMLAAAKENVCILILKARFDLRDCSLWLKGEL